MWLVDVSTHRLKEFVGQDVPAYAILSHTWGDDEVSFRETLKRKSIEDTKKKSGYKKILKACDEAAALGWDYIWIDTCCIDKKSSAELSEAINSCIDTIAIQQSVLSTWLTITSPANHGKIGLSP